MNRKKNNIFHSRTGAYWLMLLPALVWMIMINIVPMFGIVMAFQDYNPGLGIFRSEFIGLENFEYMFQMKDVSQIFTNTVVIAVGKLLLNVFVPVVFALLLNEIKNAAFKKSVQTIVYLPHFISWVIMGGILLDVFGLYGPINSVLSALGMERVAFFRIASIFRQLAIGTDVWKEFGFNAVVYLAALTGISPALYEAAAIDGASRWQRMWHITLPGLKPIIVLMTILALGNILNAGFDQIYNIYNQAVYSTGDIIDTWVYRVGLNDLQFSLATAVGLLKSVVGFLLISLSYAIAYKKANYRIF
ncbi:ABC transporter permease [Marvinbryantia sp.]|uniref:ABC transporter permease n=1 Tax=Marvinbryantia sp. TaxID=2496532 RepID=UPI0025FC4BF9|nr:ABC transporter permease subunit [uncultured Marvinbryantia sp.]